MVFRLIRCLVISLMAAAPAGAAGPSPAAFTLEQVLGAPFPSNLVASPAGGALAWVFDDRGQRNVWAAEPPDYRGRAVTAYTADDGQEILDLAFTPDGKSVVFARGGGANRRGEIPNPLSRPEGSEQAIFVAPLAPGAPRRLAEGHAPALSPKDARVAYVFKDQIWIAPLDGSEKPAQLFKARGEESGPRWSPDGSRLAFVSRRGDHAFIGLYDFSAKSLSYLDPSVDRDSNPVWSPDGKRIAFLRIPASRELQSFRPHREGEPWSLRVAEAATGKSVEIFRAGKGPGSVFHGVVAASQLLWGDGDRLVFPWEKDGWTHLYSVPAAGGPPLLLTPGDFEVEYVSLSADRKGVLFNSNQDDIERRHLWTVSPAGGKPLAITAGAEIEWAPIATSDGAAIAYLRSGARRHPQPAIRIGSAAARELAPGTIPSDFPESLLVEPQPIVFPAADGMKIHGQIFLPRGLRAGEKRPAAIFFHGGSRRQMLPGWHYNYYYRNSYAFNQYLASRGYVVLSVNYRSGIGYGMEFREALDYGAAGASEYKDVVAAGTYLRSRPDVDARRIALWGGSYGGYLTAMGLARNSDMFAAGVDFHGVHDWNDVITNFEPSYDPEKRQDVSRLAHESSPLAAVKSWRSPVLLIHGDDDRNVPFSQTVDLVEALRKNGVAFEEIIYPDEIHDFLVHAHWLAAYHAAADFLDRHLKEGPKSKVQGPKSGAP